MENLIETIKDDIKGEKLLFLSKEIYTEEEKKLIIKTVSRRVSRIFNYCELIKEFLPRVDEIIMEYKDDRELLNEIFEIGVHLDAHKRKPEHTMLDDVSFITYTMRNNMGYPVNEKYSDVVLYRLIDVEEVRKVLDGKEDSDYFEANIDFLITNNYMFRKYPEFYSEEDLKKLREIAKTPSRRDFSSRKEYQEFNFAKNELLNKLNVKKNKVFLKTK